MIYKYRTVSIDNEKLYNRLINGGWRVINTNPYNNTVQLIKG